MPPGTQIIPTFGKRKLWAERYRLGYRSTVFFYLAPCVTILALDVLNLWLVARIALVLTPFWSLRGQFKYWRHYLRRFGLPPRRNLKRMLELDRLRRIQGGEKKLSPLAESALWTGVTITAGYLLFRWTHCVVVFLPASVCAMSLVKAVIRRSRPPAIFLLGASQPQTTELLRRLFFAGLPFQTAASLLHSDASPQLKELLDFFSFRSRRDEVWREIVTGLIEMSQIVVIDVRESTEHVAFEIEYALEHVPCERLFFVTDGDPPEGIPADRAYRVAAMIVGVREILGIVPREPKETPPSKLWRDGRNEYICLVPPAGWAAVEFDDPRTKVEFRDPRHGGSLIVLACCAEGVDHRPGKAVLDEIRKTGAEVGLVTEIEQAGEPCSEVRVTLSDGTCAIGWNLIRNGINVRISAAAPTSALLAELEPEFRRALQSLRTLQSLSPTMRNQEQLANRIRKIEIKAEVQDWDDALTLLRESKAEFAHDSQSLDKLERLEKDIEAAIKAARPKSMQ